MRFAVVIWLILLTALSLAPIEVKYHFRTTGALHNFGHFMIFLLTAVLLSWKASGISGKAAGALAALTTAFALEGLEALVYRNPFEWRDVAHDSAGIFMAFVLLVVLTLLSPNRSQPGETPNPERPAEDAVAGFEKID